MSATSQTAGSMSSAREITGSGNVHGMGTASQEQGQNVPSYDYTGSRGYGSKPNIQPGLQ